MTRSGLARLVLAPAAYGFSIGAIRSWRYALQNLVKFPLLFCVTMIVCAGAYFVVARLFAPKLPFSSIRDLVVRTWGDLAVLLASLASVSLFFALTLEPPRSVRDLADYPLFLGANVVLIATCGSLTLARGAGELCRTHLLGKTTAAALLSGWLALSMLVGGQLAWFLRPFFGVRAVPEDGSFCLGARPDFRGDTSIYEAVYHLVAPPED